MKQPPRLWHGARVLAVEAALYAVLVAVYLALVLHSLAPLLLEQAVRSRGLYAATCLLLMLGQGILLEFLTTWLVRRFVRARREKRTDSRGGDSHRRQGR